MQITLRPASRDDAVFMVALEARLMREHALQLWGRLEPSATPAADTLARSRIVQAGPHRAGFLTLEPSPGHLRLRKLYLDGPWQGSGLGGRLLTQVIEEAAAQGLALRLSVLRPNTRALAFYLRHGLTIEQTTAERIWLVWPQGQNPRETIL